VSVVNHCAPGIASKLTVAGFPSAHVPGGTGPRTWFDRSEFPPTP
jgi:hypothetical protein